MPALLVVDALSAGWRASEKYYCTNVFGCVQAANQGGVAGLALAIMPGGVVAVPMCGSDMLMKRSLRQLTRTLVTGLLAALPLIVTVAVFIWLGRLLYAWLGPSSLVGQVFVGLGLGLSGSVMLGYVLGALIIVLGVYALGLLVEGGLQRGLVRLVNAVVSRIPLVRNVYDLISRFVDLLSQNGDDGLKSMRPVWCSFGGSGGVKVLGLLSTPEPVEIDGQRYLAVLVPTAPVPVGGGLLYVQESWVTPADVGMDGLTSIYVSMGVTSGQVLGRSPASPKAPDPAA